MVRLCHVCGKTSASHPDLSFHRFPVDSERRRIWFALVGMDDSIHLPKQPEICSLHFDSSDIIVKANGLRYVKPGAYPKSAVSFEEPTSTSSGSISPQVLAGSPTKSIASSTDSYEAENSSERTHQMEHFEPVAGPSRAVREERQSSSSTATASEAEREMKTFDVPQTPPAKMPRTRKRGYVGDMSSSDFSTPEKRRRNLAIVKKTVTQQRKRIHYLQMNVRRLKLRITSLKSLLTYLKEKSMISESSESTIRASLSGPPLDLFERMLKGPSVQKYNPSLRSFALTLSFYSPKAYNFVRKTFNHTLPHLATISKWYRSVDGSPGFTKEALIALSLKQKDSSNPLMCNLVMDEMSIRRQVEWTGQKFTGYVDIGTNIDEDTLPEAREVLVFMVVALNGSWKVPVGYFLLNGLSASTKADLVKKCLEFINDSGIIITSLTFDGAPVNINMAEELGADLTDPLNLKVSFKHPTTNSNIYIFLDACHMLKLVRNCLASQTYIQDNQNREIRWDYLIRLVDKQNTEGLHAATKIRMRHLQWEREKMKVRLASQTLSRSVSDAISYLRDDLHLPEFADSKATSEFLLRFNNLFDIFNSKNRFVKYQYKKPLSPKTEQHVFEYLHATKEYILGLTLKGAPLIRSARKVGFLGFCVCIDSLENMYKEFVQERKLLKYILTYKLSQDHLELFFSCIRSRGGFNNNPTARQD